MTPPTSRWKKLYLHSLSELCCTPATYVEILGMRFLQLVPQAQPLRGSLKRRALRCGVLVGIAICSSGLLLAQTAQQYMKNGDRQAAANQYQQAVQSYVSATKLEPDNGDAYTKLASAYEKLNMLNESAAASSKAAEIYEKQADTLLNRPAAAPRNTAPPAAAPPAPILQAQQPAPPTQVAPQTAVDLQSCPTQVPTGTVSRSSPPSPQTFQRVIYDFYASDEHGQLGLVFTQFQMQPTRKNIITMNAGMAEKMYPNVPEGTTVYPIKATYTSCVQDAWLAVRTVWKTDYVCMKDKFGDWSCPADSTPERLEYKLIQKKQ